MPSPITAADFNITSFDGDVCERLRKLLEINDTLKTFFGWMFNDDGTVSSEFKLLIQDIANPVGSVIWRPVNSVPAGYLHANGQAVSRTTYANLFAVYGTAHGVGDGSTTFNLPDMQRRFPIGSGGNITVGEKAGVEQHTLTIGEIPAHTHTYQRYTPGPPPTDNKLDGDNIADGGYEVVASGSAGSGQAHNNMPPYMGGLWLVKY